MKQAVLHAFQHFTKFKNGWNIGQLESFLQISGLNDKLINRVIAHGKEIIERFSLMRSNKNDVGKDLHKEVIRQNHIRRDEHVPTDMPRLWSLLHFDVNSLPSALALLKL